jgi:hypothetical protein
MQRGIKTTPAGDTAAAPAPLANPAIPSDIKVDAKNPAPVINEADLKPGAVSIKQNEQFDDLIITATKEGNYSKLESLIMIHLDALDGIETKVDIDKTKIKYPTGVALIRDATNSLPLQKRLAPDHPTILAENMLLRAINTMRGIDYVLEKKGLHKEREKLKLRTLQLIAEITAFKNQNKVIDKTKSLHEIENIQTNFNSALIQTLHTSKLDEGLKNEKDYAHLLQHYRDLASTLDPAKSLITIFKDQRENDKKKVEITHTETSHPITKKTDKQKNIQLKLMQEINPATKEKNYHSEVKPAFRIANAFFSELIAKDDRRLSAQNKNTVGPTAKNPYTVNNEIVFAILPDTDDGKIEVKHSSFKSLRCGTPVYLGKHASDIQRTDYAIENLQQLATAAKEFAHADKVHITLVLTDSILQDQHTVYEITNAARKKLGIEMSYVPINAEGTARLLEISPLIKSKPNSPSIHSNVGDKAARVAKARDIILLASENTITQSTDEKTQDTSDSKQVRMINLTICASGQDRTGTAQEIATQQWIADEYKKQIGIIFPQKNKERAIEDVAMMRAMSGHNVVLATLAAPGSPGLKKDSLPGAYFSEAVNALLYRTTAKTNKESHIDKLAVSLIQTQNLDTLIDPEDKHVGQQADAKNQAAVEMIVTDDDIKWLTFRVTQIANHYKETHKTKKAHGDDIDLLAKSIESIAKDVKNTNQIKLDLIVKKLNDEAWDKGIIKKISKESNKESPSDQLITFLNIEKNRNDHSFYRQIGNLLQDIEIKFPMLKSAVISRSQTQRQHLLSERLSYRNDIAVTKEDTEKLINEISVLKKLDPTTYAGLSNILELKFDFRTTYIELISALNTLWTTAVEKNASIFDFRDTRQQRCEALKIKINKAAKDHVLLQALGTILQNAQQNKPSMNVRPKIIGLIPYSLNMEVTQISDNKKMAL